MATTNRAHIEYRQRSPWLWRGVAIAVSIGISMIVFWNSSEINLRSWFGSSSNGEQERQDTTNALRAGDVGPTTVSALRSDEVSDVGAMSSVQDKPTRLVLTGTLVNGRSGQPLAYIGIDSHNPQTYTVGSILANGAKIVEIAGTYVVIEKNRRVERLYNGNAAQPRMRVNDNDSLLFVGGPRALETATATIDSAAPIVSQAVRVSPYYKDSRVLGVAVYPGNDVGAFAGAGLRTGDVVTSINGQTLAATDQITTLLSFLDQGLAFNATVIRAGEEITITIDGKKLQGASTHSQRPT